MLVRWRVGYRVEGLGTAAQTCHHPMGIELMSYGLRFRGRTS